MQLGETKSRQEFKRKIGIFTAEVVAINPDAEEIAKLYGSDDVKDEPVYLKEKEVDVPTGKVDSDGKQVTEKITVDTARIDIYLAVTKDGSIQKRSFWLEDRPFLKKDASSRQYINSLGKTAWSDSKENLRQNFTHVVSKEGVVGDSKNIREAKVGEADLVEFIDQWLHLRDRKNDKDVRFDTKKVLKGNFKEISSLIKSDIAGLVMGALEVREVTNDDGIKFYNDVWKKFLPDYNAKFFANTKYDDTKLEALKEKDKATRAKIKDKTVGKSDWLKPHETFIIELTGEYGSKNHYSLSPIHDFDENNIEVAHSQPIDTASAEY